MLKSTEILSLSSGVFRFGVASMVVSKNLFFKKHFREKKFFFEKSAGIKMKLKKI
jgi:hypothetical protein